MDLRTFRVRHHLTQSDVAKLLKKHVTTISKYETGDIVPSLKTMDAIGAMTKGEVTSRDFLDNFKGERKNGKGSKTGHEGRIGASSPEAVQN